jgi:hypothetical protein
MAIQQLPINGETKIINGVSYVYTAANSSWTIGTSVPQSTEIVYSDSLYISGSNGITFADGTKQITAASGSGIDSYARTTANSATTLAQASFDKANTGTSTGIDSYARTTANSATVLAQAAFDVANTASNNITIIQGVNTTQNTNITIVTNAVTGAYTQANLANVLAQAAFDKANTGSTDSLIPKIVSINVANSLYYTLDDAAVNTGGGYIVISGSNFATGASVLVDTTLAPAVTYANSTTLNVQVPAKSAASYNIYVVNPDGGTGIKVNGLTYSTNPTWVTASSLTGQNANAAFSINLSATDAVTYSVADDSTLPAGTSLLANGYFFGTISTISSPTNYSFTIAATDAELQDSYKTFQLYVAAGAPGLWSWGWNPQGQLGQNDTILRSSPVQVGLVSNWSKAYESDSYSMAIRTDGTLWTWGYNGFGTLGHNNVIARSSPVQVGTGINWSANTAAAAINGSGVAAIKTDGTLWSWGARPELRAGAAALYRSSPTQVGTLTNWSKVFISPYNSATLSIKTNGTLWTWGYATTGILGDNTRVDRSSPVQVGALTNWNTIDVNEIAAAIKTDGTLWTWGDVRDGQQGLNDRVARSSPVQVGTGTDWSMVKCTSYHTVALKTDGTLWTWGRNSFGQLGQNSSNNSLISRSSPVQVGTGTTWNGISIKKDSTLATKTDGTLWAWGSNSAGELGILDKINRSSPVQVGSSIGWTLTSSSNYRHILILKV